MKKRIISALLVVLIMFLSINVKIESQAKEVDLLSKVDVIRNEQNLATVEIDISDYKTNDCSMKIEIPNILLESINDTRKITDEQKEWLTKNGYLESFEKLVTRQDYLNAKNKIFISNKETIIHIKEIYPELYKEDLSKWTYEKFNTYSQERSKDIEYFTDVEKVKLQSRGLVLIDAIYMLKEYGSYEEIINLSDKEIKEFLIKYYDKKLLYAKYIKYAGQLYEKEAIDIDSVINSKQYDNGDYEYGDGVGDYDSVIVPGYNNGNADLFLKTTNTDNGDNNITAAAATQKIWTLAFKPNGVNTRTTYYARNLWGTKSDLMGQAHGGLDLPGKPDHYVDLYAIMGASLSGYTATGNMIDLNDNIGTACYYIQYSHYPYTVFYSHSTGHATGYIVNGDNVGVEGGVGGFDPHLHFSVNTGYNTTYGLYHGDGGLTSSNPYIFISRHSNGYYSWD